MVCEFFSGSYAEPGEDGIVRFRLDTEAGTLTKVYACQSVKNPSYVRLSADKSVLYAVQEETPRGAVHALRVGERGLTPMGALSTEGADPCYIGLSEDASLLFAANYTSGSLAVFTLNADGGLEERAALLTYEGGGVHPTRQEGPHIHCAAVRGGQVFVADLGSDLIYIYDVEAETRRLSDSGKRLSLPPGTGPRHIAFRSGEPAAIYVICELSNQVMTYLPSGAGFALAQSLPTLPDSFRGENTAAAIKLSGDLLFASNRGHDSIAVYRVLDSGLPEPTQIAPAVGGGPRDFALFGDYMVVANQYTSSLNVLRVNRQNGTLEDTGISASTPHPCRIQRI